MLNVKNLFIERLEVKTHAYSVLMGNNIGYTGPRLITMQKSHPESLIIRKLICTCFKMIIVINANFPKQNDVHYIRFLTFPFNNLIFFENVSVEFAEQFL